MNTKMRRTWPVVLAALAFIAAFAADAALAEEKYEEKFAKTVPLSQTGKLYLSNVSGDIEIMTAKDAQVRIEALKISKADTVEKAKENAAKVTIEVTGEANLVRVETKYPKRTGGFFGGESIKVSVDYKVWIPDKASVEINSVSGDVQVAPIGGQAKIHCVSGDVELHGAAGADVNLTSGDLMITEIAGDAFIESVSGDIEITRVKGSVEVEAVSGDIEILEVAGAQKIGAKSVSGDITYAGAILAGGRYEIKAHSGDVHVTIPAGSSFDLEANTFNGDIDTDFEIKVVGKISPREVRGTVGQGGATVILKTFSGNVDLKKK